MYINIDCYETRLLVSSPLLTTYQLDELTQLAYHLYVEVVGQLGQFIFASPFHYSNWSGQARRLNVKKLLCPCLVLRLEKCRCVSVCMTLTQTCLNKLLQYMSSLKGLFTQTQLHRIHCCTHSYRRVLGRWITVSIVLQLIMSQWLQLPIIQSARRYAQYGANKSSKSILPPGPCPSRVPKNSKHSISEEDWGGSSK